MKDETGIQRWGTGWALPVSVGLHLLVAALLILDLPPLLAEPHEEEPVQVELVPPPDAAKPEPPPAPAEPEKPAEPEPPAEPEKPQEAAKPPSDQKAQPPAPPVLNPVVQFGERDAGPRQTLDGNSAEEGAETPPPKSAQAEAPPEPPAGLQDGAEEGAEQPSPEQAEALPEPPAGPQESAAVGPEGLPSGEAEEEGTEVSLPETSAIPPPRPTLRAAAASQPPLQEAQRLFSQSATGTQVATTAMGNIPREVRAGRLCTTELREQLRAGSPPYFPDLLPTYPLEHGNVLDIPTAAFRVRGQWVDLSFRCTVDSQATRVLSFAHRVGMAIPRSEWAARGLPGG